MELNLILTSLYLGILTSISPCPLASNIAAISFISQEIIERKYIFFSSLLYTLGRCLTYILLSFLILKITINIPFVSMYLQIYMNKILSVLLIIVGLILIDIIKIPAIGLNFSQNPKEKIEKFGLFGSLIIGFIFALSFCPVSAALYFGSLIPLSISSNSFFFLPLFYGIGTSIPIFVFAVLLFFGSGLVEKTYKGFKKGEFYARKITGIVFILIGVYYALSHIFKVL